MTAAGRSDGRVVPVETVEVSAAGERRERRHPQPGAGRTGPGNGRQRTTCAGRHRSGRVGQDHRNADPGAAHGTTPEDKSLGSRRPLRPPPRSRAETGITSDTLAKLVHDLDTGNPSPALSIGPETLVIIDEAGMADTLTLARVIDHAIDNGASVRLIGDDQQLSAIGAGGVLRDIAANHGAARLGRTHAVHRRRRSRRLSWPCATVTLRLSGTTSTRTAFTSAAPPRPPMRCSLRGRQDRADGLDSLMLAPTHDLVTELNQRARTARLDNTTPDAEVELADGNRASIGDTIRTRRNDRRLAISPTDWVKNGDRWTDHRRPRRLSSTARHTRSGLHVTLPAPYVAQHVELGYASTVHSAQGLTADTMHGVVTGTESRETLYTMMTRGRHANHVHLAVGGDGDPHQLLHPDTREPATATEILEAILARTGAAVSATTTAREATSPAAQLHEATTKYADALVAAAEDVLGPDRILEIAHQAEELLAGLTDATGWPSLSAQLLMIESSGLDARDLLENAFTYRPLDDADDAALVLGWRLHTLAPTEGGPLPWLPAIPAKLTEDPTWGTYLAERAEQVSTLAGDLRRSTINDLARVAAAERHSPRQPHERRRSVARRPRHTRERPTADWSTAGRLRGPRTPTATRSTPQPSPRQARRGVDPANHRARRTPRQPHARPRRTTRQHWRQQGHDVHRLLESCGAPRTATR